MAEKVKAAGDEFMRLEYHFDAGANAMRLKIGSFEKEQTKVLGQESIFSPADRPAPHLVKVRFLNNSAMRSPNSQTDWCNNCGIIHRSMKFSACVDNVPRQIYSYGANRNTVYVSLSSHFSRWPPKEHCSRIEFCLMKRNQ